MSSHFSRESEELTSDSNGPDTESSDSAKRTPQPDEFSSGIGPEFHSRKMCEPLTLTGCDVTAFVQNQRDEIRTIEVAGALAAEPGMKQQTFIAFNWQTGTDQLQPSEEVSPSLHKGQTPAVSISSPADSHARTCRSQENERDLPVNDQDCSSRQPESLTLFSDPEDGCSLRTFPDSFHPTEAVISQSFSRRWPNSGFMTSPTEFWTADTSECPNGGGEFSSLPDVLEATVPSRFFLSPRAAAGILRRAERRGRDLPEHLGSALRELSAMAAGNEGGR